MSLVRQPKTHAKALPCVRSRPFPQDGKGSAKGTALGVPSSRPLTLGPLLSGPSVWASLPHPFPYLPSTRLSLLGFPSLLRSSAWLSRHGTAHPPLNS